MRPFVYIGSTFFAMFFGHWDMFEGHTWMCVCVCVSNVCFVHIWSQYSPVPASSHATPRIEVLGGSFYGCVCVWCWRVELH